MYSDNELFFPHTAIAALNAARGPEWSALVARIAALPETHPDTLAFMLMMIRLNGCVSCETDSYRAMRGCTACAIQTLRRYKGSDADLIALFAAAQADIHQFSESRPAVLAAIRSAAGQPAPA